MMNALVNGACNGGTMEFASSTMHTITDSKHYKRTTKRMSNKDILTSDALAGGLKRRRLNLKMNNLEVVEQPQSFGHLFVKPGQLPSTGSYIKGEKSTVGNVTHPGLLLTNYQGLVKLVWYLVADDARYPHPYMLEGKDCKDGVCTKTIQADGQIISFPELYVRSIARKEVKDMLGRRLDILKEHLPGTVFKLKDPMEYNLSTVRICFQALLQDSEENEKAIPVLTKQLRNKEPSLQREPRILSISQCKGSVQGREELSLQVTNLKTDDVFVFFHSERLVPRTSWQAFADVISISRRKAQPVDIVVRTPPFHDLHITEPQTADIQIRLIDNSISNTVKYTYTPKVKGASKIEQRVKQKEPIYVQHFTCLGATAPMGSVLGMGNEERGAEGSQAATRVPMYVYKLRQFQAKQAEKKVKPKKVNAESQTEERFLRSEDSLEGYDSEEELGVTDDRVDYNRLERYRALMMGPDESEQESLQEGKRMSWSDFTPKGVLGSLHSGSAPSARSSKVISTSHSSTESENLARNMSLMKLQSQSPQERVSLSPLGSMTMMGGELSNPDWSSKLMSGKGTNADQGENTPNNPDTAIKRHFGRHIYECLSKSSHITAPVNLHHPGASNLPDLTQSGLYPALLDTAENQTGLPSGLVAIKEISKSHFQEKEYSLWQSLEHKSLIKMFGLLKMETSIIPILEFPGKGCLKDYLSRRDPPTWEEQSRWIQQIAEGLHCLHENRIAHMDVRSENCLISDDSDLILNIPSTLILSGTSPDEKDFELPSASDENFGKAKADDVFSYAAVCFEILKGKDFTSNVKTPMNAVISKFLSVCKIFEKCQLEDNSQRPTIGEVVGLLPDLMHQQEKTSAQSAVPYFTVQPASIDQTLDQQSAENDVLAGCFTDPIPSSPDSGVGYPMNTIEKPVTQTDVSLSARPEQADSVASRESAFSDGSQKSEGNVTVVSAEYSVPHCLGDEKSQAASPTHSDAPSKTEKETEKSQESGDTPGDENLEVDGESTDDGHGDSGRQGGDQSRQDGDQGHGRREDESLGSHLCPPRVTKRIDHTGGMLSLFDGEISLQIPPGALREGQEEDITLTVDWNDRHIPPLAPTDLNVSPIVHCGPTGLQFEKHVILQLPHCSVISNPKHCKMTVHCTQTEEGEPPEWRRIPEQDNDEGMQVEFQDQYFLLRVTHFTLFTITLDGGKETLAKEIMVVAYGQDVITLDADQEIRVYLYDFYSGNREKIHQEEKHLNGKQLDGPCSYQLHELHQGSMVVEVLQNPPSWLLKSSSPKVKYSFNKMWNLHSWNRCKFTFSNTTKQATQFWCHIIAQQIENDEKAVLEISNHVKTSPESLFPGSSGRHDDTPTCRSPSGPRVTEHVSYREKQTMQRGIHVSVTKSADSGWSNLDSTSATQFSSNFDSCRSGDLSLELFRSQISLMPSGPSGAIPYELEKSLRRALDPYDEAMGNDWRMLASLFGYDDFIRIWKKNPSPTGCILSAIQQEQKIGSFTELSGYLKQMHRYDAAKLVEDFRPRMCTESTRSVLESDDNEPMDLMGNTPSPDNDSPLTGGQNPFVGHHQGTFPDLAQSVPDRRSLSGSQNVLSNVNQVAQSSTIPSGGHQGTAVNGHVPSSGELPHASCQPTSGTEPVPNCLADNSPRSSQNESQERSPGCRTPWGGPSSRPTDENKNIRDLKNHFSRKLKL